MADKDEDRSTPAPAPLFDEPVGRGAQMTHRIGRAIVSGVYPPQSRLPDEPEMLSTYSVSRTALREAYSKLAAKGLIQARPKVGTSVRPHADWNMLDPEVLEWHLQTKPSVEIAHDLFALRRMVEPAAAATAASKRTAAALERIGIALDNMIADADDEQKLIEADYQFHLEILLATQNHFIGAFSALVRAGLTNSFQLSWRSTGAKKAKQSRIAQHGRVLDAIRAQNAGVARSEMEHLLDDAFSDLMDALDVGTR